MELIKENQELKAVQSRSQGTTRQLSEDMQIEVSPNESYLTRLEKPLSLCFEMAE